MSGTFGPWSTSDDDAMTMARPFTSVETGPPMRAPTLGGHLPLPRRWIEPAPPGPRVDRSIEVWPGDRVAESVPATPRRHSAARVETERLRALALETFESISVAAETIEAMRSAPDIFQEADVVVWEAYQDRLRTDYATAVDACNRAFGELSAQRAAFIAERFQNGIGDPLLRQAWLDREKQFAREFSSE